MDLIDNSGLTMWDIVSKGTPGIVIVLAKIVELTMGGRKLCW